MLQLGFAMAILGLSSHMRFWVGEVWRILVPLVALVNLNVKDS